MYIFSFLCQISEKIHRKGSKRAKTPKNIRIKKKMIKVFLEHCLANVFANFQRDISFNAEASPMTNYQSTCRKYTKRAITLKHINNLKKVRKAILDNNLIHAFTNFQLFISITV